MNNTSTPPAIKVRDLRKAYGSKRAVDGLDLDIYQGEIFAILGPNGAGKSTTVEILEGLRLRDTGQVEVLGTDPGQADRHWRSRIGVVMQDSRDIADLTVREMVKATAAYYPNPLDPEQVISAVSLTEKADARVRGLSGGQRRRLDVALGIIGRPELLFLDEPTTGFDPEVRREFWQLVRDLNTAGVTIVLTTHYLDEADALADRMAVIKDGKVVALATPAELGGPEARRPIVEWIENGVKRSQRTDNPTGLITALTATHADAGGEIVGINIINPTLEDVYLDLIGAAK
ncbi:MAG: ABC transporter ATP-binding protein [Promicromonosporaceae bacterium]|nr:ABC transporter ATP-binding protein [Promicromonosporaceae bacterium]